MKTKIIEITEKGQENPTRYKIIDDSAVYRFETGQEVACVILEEYAVFSDSSWQLVLDGMGKHVVIPKSVLEDKLVVK